MNNRFCNPKEPLSMMVLIATVATIVFLLVLLGLTILCATSERHRRGGEGFNSNAPGGDKLSVGVMHVYDGANTSP